LESDRLSEFAEIFEGADKSVDTEEHLVMFISLKVPHLPFLRPRANTQQTIFTKYESKQIKKSANK